MGKVKNILSSKGSAVFSVEPGVTVFQAIQIMCEKNIGGLLITDQGNLVGIFTERDYARKLILKGKSSKDILIRELMTENPVSVTPDSSIDECMQIMSSKRIRHLPVVVDKKPVGMISIGDVVRHIMEEQKEIIEHLEAYISR